ncbi:MAG TPA: DUF3862 domain-containing protein [Pyrinomonadaceae bacterium]|jgi:hypothetical protein
MKNSNTLLLVLVISLLVLGGVSCSRLNASKQDSSTETSDGDSKPGLTLENFNRIKTGMSYKEVVEILGSEGESIMSVGGSQGDIASYKWERKSPSQSVTIIFTDGKMSTKMQMRLK